jgi:hypothetical protein
VSNIEHPDEETASLEVRAKRKRLNRTQSHAAQRLLVERLSDPGQVTRGVEFFQSLPSDLSCAAFIEAWEVSPDAREELLRTLLSHRVLANHHGQRRKLRLAVRSAGRHPDLAVAILHDMAVSAAKGGVSDHVLSELTEMIRSDRETLTVVIEKAPPRDVREVLGLIVSAGLVEDDGTTKWLEWVADQAVARGVGLSLKRGVTRRLDEKCRVLPEDVQRKCSQAGLVSVISTRPSPPDGHLPAVGRLSDQPVVTPAPAGEHVIAPQTPERPEGDPLLGPVRRGIGTLLEHIGVVEANIVRLRQRLDYVGRQHEASLAELGSARAEVERLSVLLRASEAHVAEVLGQQARLQEESKRLATLHQGEVEHLNVQLSREGDHVLGEFRNILSEALRGDHTEFLQSEVLPMDERLAKFLRSRFRMVWKTLEFHGIKPGGKA